MMVSFFTAMFCRNDLAQAGRANDTRLPTERRFRPSQQRDGWVALPSTTCYGGKGLQVKVLEVKKARHGKLGGIPALSQSWGTKGTTTPETGSTGLGHEAPGWRQIP